MGDLRFRAATRKDQDFFGEMEFETTWESLDEASRAQIGPERFREALAATHEMLLDRSGNRIVVAEDESGERVGLLWYGLNRNLITGEDEAWIYNISVVPAHRNQGVGRRLMEHAEELARKGGHRTLGLMVASHNEGARRLYERLDFRATNLLMRKRLEPEDGRK